MAMTPEWAMNQALAVDPREANLPKYAQHTLRILRTALAEQAALARSAVAATDPEGSTAILNPWEDHGGIGLGKRATVRFQALGRGYVDIQVRDDGVELHGQHDLVIRPKVSNAAEVYSRSTKDVFGA